MLKTILLMCAGTHPEWGGTPKQLISVYDNKPLITYTSNQLTSLGHQSPVVVTNEKRLHPHLKILFDISDDRRHNLCESIFTTRRLWMKTTVVLLGDVLYTTDILRVIFGEADLDGVCFYGTNKDIFALTFTERERVNAAMQYVLEQTARGNGRGGLWELYYALSGQDIKQARNGYTRDRSSNIFTLVRDGTRDFDTPADYLDWARENL